MKRIITLALCLITALSLYSCTRIEFEYALDLTDEEDLYGVIEDYISNPDKCNGRSVKISAECTVVYNFSENKIARRSLLIRDKDSDMRALYEFRSSDGKYPRTGSTVELGGVFTDGYIEVKEYFNADFSGSKFDVDALGMSADDLKAYIKEFSDKCNDFKDFGKTVRIFGNVTVSKGEDYIYFGVNGFDAAGSRTWNILLTADSQSVTLPETDSKYVNAYEIVGVLDMYMEDYIAYPCIRVTEIRAVEGILKAEEESDQPITVNPGQ